MKNIFKERLAQNKTTSCEYLWQPHYTYLINAPLLNKEIYTPEFFLVALLIFCVPSSFGTVLWAAAFSGICLFSGMFHVRKCISYLLFFPIAQNHPNITALWQWAQTTMISKKNNSLGHNVQPGAFMQKWKMSIVLPSIILPISLAYNTSLRLMAINAVHTLQ